MTDDLKAENAQDDNVQGKKRDWRETVNSGIGAKKRAENFRKRQKEQGLRARSLFLTDSEWSSVKAYLKQIREENQLLSADANEIQLDK